MTLVVDDATEAGVDSSTVAQFKFRPDHLDVLVAMFLSYPRASVSPDLAAPYQRRAYFESLGDILVQIGLLGVPPYYHASGRYCPHLRRTIIISIFSKQRVKDLFMNVSTWTNVEFEQHSQSSLLLRIRCIHDITCYTFFGTLSFQTKQSGT